MFTKAELLGYTDYCRGRARRTLDALTENAAVRQSRQYADFALVELELRLTLWTGRPASTARLIRSCAAQEVGSQHHVRVGYR
jgi:hypothetical protein